MGINQKRIKNQLLKLSGMSRKMCKLVPSSFGRGKKRLTDEMKLEKQDQ